ncbi:MAG: hypothetical protein IT542_06495 [Rubellimicrobium sp.]|nr:hypothetical protein [Rubellimicrobium sp.]
MAEPFVAVVDSGGSKTAAAVAFRDGSVRLAPRRAGSNPQDNPDWSEVLDTVYGPLAGAEHAVLALAGYGEVPSIDAALARKTLDMLGPDVTLLNDVALAARSAFPKGGGVLILSGTGSMAVATGPDGTVRTGGWGDLFSDEGSAYWIGREALARASHERDGRAEDRGLALALETRLGLTGGGRFALLGWALGQSHPRAGIASLALMIDTLAETGLAPARDILDGAARELAHLGRSAAGQAGLAGPFAWAPAGSVFRSRIMRRSLAELLQSEPVEPAASALAGGLILAAETAGWPTGGDWQARVVAACRDGAAS